MVKEKNIIKKVKSNMTVSLLMVKKKEMENIFMKMANII